MFTATKTMDDYLVRKILIHVLISGAEPGFVIMGGGGIEFFWR